ncbi:MAG: DUF4974 domain-containing protein [Gemmatimonas sp.]|nr:DUF4974 domain-containing protein [Gemmatimonas sp.]
MNDDTLARTITGRASDAEVVAVEAWRRQSPENERRFQAAARLLQLTSEGDSGRVPGLAPTANEIVEAAEAAVREESGTGRSGGPPGASRSYWLGRWGIAAAAAGISFLLGLFIARSVVAPADVPTFAAEQFVTGSTEQATVVLNDGTVVRLAPESRISVPTGAATRDVTLVGQAYFAVAHDESRLFTVRTSSGDVRVLGTRFTLEADAEDLRLVVVEGSVVLADREERNEVHVRRNQMVRVVRGTRLPVAEVPDATALTEWVGSFLAFQDTPLRDAIREVEREYGVQVDISDAVLLDRTFTAWFDGWPLADVMEVVCMVAGAECEVSDSLVTMTAGALAR